ncbi:MAG: hypothetical protein F6K17_22695 [Okeania sp. SIO3C4]|nr:hypothetical protein [Okeania sp. SIO3C4]
MIENPFIEILEFQKLSKKSESLIGFNIDSPQKDKKTVAARFRTFPAKNMQSGFS